MKNKLPVVPGHNLVVVFATLIASSGTLLCCVLPATMAAIGAGATMASLVTAVPQLVTLSYHKGIVFAVAGISLAISGWLVWRAQRYPCPIDPQVAMACSRLRRFSRRVWSFACVCAATGALFAYVLPRLL